MAHPHDHSHDGHSHEGHSHASASTPKRPLIIALALTGSFLIVEAVAGWMTGSLALLSDAGHMLTDAGALGLALFAQVLAARTRTGVRTFGFRRAEILAALINGSVLGVSAVWVIVEALRRLSDPHDIQGAAMMIVAFIGLIVNVISAWVLSREAKTNTNMRAAYLHVLADAAGSIAAIVAGALVLWLGWKWADSAASIAISMLILWGAWRLVRDSVHVLMEGAPTGVDAALLEKTILSTQGVASLHDLHLWTITDGFPLLTVHVVLDGASHGTDVARAVAIRVRDAHGIDHVTVQPEAPAAGLVTLKTP